MLDSSKHVIVAENVGIEYDLNLTRHRTLRQTISDTVRRTRTKSQKFWALEDVSFELPRGEVLGVIGRNGSGKSTLLFAIAGILIPDRGRIATAGKTFPLLTLGAGFEADLTGRENIYLNAAFLGVPRKLAEERIDAIIEFSDLGAFIDVPIRKYSSGMRARLGFSIAAHVEPDILLLDEVMGVGDAAFYDKSKAKLKELMKRAQAIVIVSHNADFILETCTTSLWLEDGRVAGEGPPEEVMDDYLAAANKPRRVIRATA